MLGQQCYVCRLRQPFVLCFAWYCKNIGIGYKYVFQKDHDPKRLSQKIRHGKFSICENNCSPLLSH